MRAIFGVLSLVIVLAVVGLLAKKQMGPLQGSGTDGSSSGVTSNRQNQQTPQQIKSTVEGLMQARPVPDDK
jgi:hypothetical protein